jgi:hypothetical protein
VAQAFTIAAASQAITFGALANKTFGDAPFAVSATASSGLALSFAAAGNCSVSGNTVTVTGAGSCTITASQPGNANYSAAPDVAQPFTIAAASQAITFGALANKTFGDAPFAVSATASSSLAVSFAAAGNCTVSGNMVTLTGGGNCTITASQPGNANYGAAPDVARSFTIGTASQTITFGALANKTFGDAPFAVNATASSGLAVSFAATGNCSVSGNTVTLTGAGSCSITASQAGNSNYSAAPDVAQPFTTAAASQTITFGVLANKTFGDAPFAVNATASSGLVVTFAAAGNCTVSGDTVTLTGTGNCTITASQAGDANHNAAPEVVQPFTIGAASQAITFGSLTNKTFGGAPFAVSATASSGLAVTFAGAGNCTVSGNTVTLTGAGSCTITASQVGDTNYTAAPDVTQAFTIGAANQAITFGALANKTFGDAPFAVSATASSGLAVSFAAAGSCTISGNTVTLTGGGGCTITASQAGDSNYSAAPSVPQSFTIGTASQIITFAPLANKTFGDAPFAVSATASSGLAVTFSAAGNCTVGGNTVTLTAPGSCTITASQAGNTSYSAAANAGQSFTIGTPAPTDIAGPVILNLLVTPNPVQVNTATTLTATANDTSTGGSSLASVEYRIDGGPYLPMSASDGTFNSAVENITSVVAAFPASGIHELCVRGKDVANNVGAESCVLLAVYDPEGGFVTGGGWIDSPIGAYAANPALTGKANFAFNSKYAPGANIPTGQTQFKFKTADLEFQSTSYEWLVVAGARAQFKGAGTINGTGSYQFMLTAIDANLPGGGSSADKFRIKITGDGGGVVYDNKMGSSDSGNDSTEIGGGSIVIHKP